MAEDARASSEYGLELAETFAAIGRELMAAHGVDETLAAVVRLALSTIDHCDHAAVSLITRQRVSTQASTGEVPRRVDAIQYETGQGPCLDAMRTHDVYVTDDLALEARWPEFAARAARETGVHSMLGFRLFTDVETFGALNLFSEAIAAFDERAEALGVVFAAHAAIALSGARIEENLELALGTRGVIALAQGILIERRHITPEEAFGVLRTVSQDHNVKLRDVAADVVETGSDPEDEPGR